MPDECGWAGFIPSPVRVPAKVGTGFPDLGFSGVHGGSSLCFSEPVGQGVGDDCGSWKHVCTNFAWSQTYEVCRAGGTLGARSVRGDRASRRWPPRVSALTPRRAVGHPGTVGRSTRVGAVWHGASGYTSIQREEQGSDCVQTSVRRYTQATRALRKQRGCVHTPQWLWANAGSGPVRGCAGAQ